jgi:hypothetical protein
MSTCAFCGNIILFGGKRSGNLRFCSEKCFRKGSNAIAADRLYDELPEELIQKQIQAVHQGDCPRCGRPGPVDFHESHRVWSAIHLTSWKTRTHLTCRSCGVKAQLGDTLYSMLLGWWGVPFGLVLTPVQIIRNIAGMVRGPDPSRPSLKLDTHVRLDLANRAAAIHASAKFEQMESADEMEPSNYINRSSY